MPKAVFVVQTNPASPEQEAEFNHWYDKIHVPEICSISGFVSAKRYKLSGPSAPGTPAYLAIYEIDADDPAAPLAEIKRRSAAGELSMSDTLQMDPTPIVALYDGLG